MAPCKKNIPPKKEDELSEKDLEKVAGGYKEKEPVPVPEPEPQNASDQFTLKSFPTAFHI